MIEENIVSLPEGFSFLKMRENLADKGYRDFKGIGHTMEMASGNHNTVILDRIDNVAHFFYSSQEEEQLKEVIKYIEEGDCLIGKESAKMIVDYCLRRLN